MVDTPLPQHYGSPPPKLYLVVSRWFCIFWIHVCQPLYQEGGMVSAKVPHRWGSSSELGTRLPSLNRWTYIKKRECLGEGVIYNLGNKIQHCGAALSIKKMSGCKFSQYIDRFSLVNTMLKKHFVGWCQTLSNSVSDMKVIIIWIFLLLSVSIV